MKIEHTFLLQPTTLSFHERLKLASFSWINKDITEKKLGPIIKRDKELKVFAVSFDQPLGYERVRERFLKEGYKPGTVSDLVDVTISYPELYSQFPIYSVEKEIELRYGGIVNAHPALKFSGTAKKRIKELSLLWYMGEWPAGTLFICYK